MKKIIIASLLFILVFATVVLAISYTREERQAISECKRNCSHEYRAEIVECRDSQNSCRATCKDDFDTCKAELRSEELVCDTGCLAVFNTTINGTDDRREISRAKRELRKCEVQCTRDYRAGVREECSLGQCRRDCSTENRECRSEARDVFSTCRQTCPVVALGNTVTCENGAYELGDVVIDHCEYCTCAGDGKLHCMTSRSCNYDNFSNDKFLCESAGGFYDNVCSGNHFYGLSCSNDERCICDGLYNYTCPDNQQCLHDFFHESSPASSHNWVDQSNRQLGDIGVCVPIPVINLCGNGVCESVAAGEGKWIVENAFNCPADCGAI